MWMNECTITVHCAVVAHVPATAVCCVSHHCLLLLSLTFWYFCQSHSHSCSLHWLCRCWCCLHCGLLRILLLSTVNCLVSIFCQFAKGLYHIHCCFLVLCCHHCQLIVDLKYAFTAFLQLVTSHCTNALPLMLLLSSVNCHISSYWLLPL